MCTAIGINLGGSYYFGRTLDVCSSLGEEVVLTPRNFEINFKSAPALKKHYAILGTAHVSGGFPLYYDGMNDRGLCMAGLNFPGNAVYHPKKDDKVNLASFELILYILGACASVKEAKAALQNVSVADISFSEGMPHTPLHWLIGDKTGEIVVESVADGLKVYDNPAGVLTNNPPFEEQLFNLKNYARLSPHDPDNTFSRALDLKPYSRGMGALGLPGDWSSPSRFVRAAFVKFNYGGDEFFDILDRVVVPKGCVISEEGCQYTVYSCRCDTKKGEYIKKTEHGMQVCADFHSADLNAKMLIRV